MEIIQLWRIKRQHIKKLDLSCQEQNDCLSNPLVTGSEFGTRLEGRSAPSSRLRGGSFREWATGGKCWARLDGVELLRKEFLRKRRGTKLEKGKDGKGPNNIFSPLLHRSVLSSCKRYQKFALYLADHHPYTSWQPSSAFPRVRT